MNLEQIALMGVGVGTAGAAIYLAQGSLIGAGTFGAILCLSIAVVWQANRANQKRHNAEAEEYKSDVKQGLFFYNQWQASEEKINALSSFLFLLGFNKDAVLEQKQTSTDYRWNRWAIALKIELNPEMTARMQPIEVEYLRKAFAKLRGNPEPSVEAASYQAKLQCAGPDPQTAASHQSGADA